MKYFPGIFFIALLLWSFYSGICESYDDGKYELSRAFFKLGLRERKKKLEIEITERYESGKRKYSDEESYDKYGFFRAYFAVNFNPSENADMYLKCLSDKSLVDLLEKTESEIDSETDRRKREYLDMIKEIDRVENVMRRAAKKFV